MSMKVAGRLANTAFHLAKQHTPGVDAFVESFRPNQIRCKQWLVDEVANYHTVWNNVLVLGSWNSCLLYEMMNEQCKVKWWDFVDNDPLCHLHRDQYFAINDIEQNYSSIIEDAQQFSAFSDYDLIINTSCEHMDDIPAIHGPLYALQSNNYDSIDEHINTCSSVDNFVDKTGLTELVFRGEINMNHYDRYMVVGFYD